MRPVTEALIKRYRFLKYPQTADDYADPDNGVYFGQGFWNDIAIEEFRILPQGILIGTGESTDRTEELFLDAMQLWSEAGITFSPELVRHRMYVSQIVVQSDVDLVSLYEPLEGLVAATFEGVATGAAAVGFFIGTVDANTPIRVERLVDVPTSELKFWAQAPMPTNKHLEFLAEWERVLRR